MKVDITMERNVANGMESEGHFALRSVFTVYATSVKILFINKNSAMAKLYYKRMRNKFTNPLRCFPFFTYFR